MAGDELNQTPTDAPGDGKVRQDLLAAGLPDDVLADVLRRVAPRWLAASRCVCKAWRDVVDARCLLRADLLPLSFVGLFIHFYHHKFPEFLARPSSSSAASGPRFSGDFSFLPSAHPECGSIWHPAMGDHFWNYKIKDHCNGLLLLSGNYVVNPATRRWYSLPMCPSEHVAESVCYEKCLVYDPMVSPYYNVFSIPICPPRDEAMEESEWPPSLYKMYLFSSKSGSWEEKDFVREGNAAGTFREMQKGYCEFRAVNFGGALYVHCRPNFVMRVSLSNNTYNAVTSPMYRKMEGKMEGTMDTMIARSKDGVYFLALREYWLQVWILNESCGRMEWMLKLDKDLKSMLARHRFVQPNHVPWNLEDINYKLFRSSHSLEVNNRPPTINISGWNSDSDDGVENEGVIEHCDSEDSKITTDGNKLECRSFGDYYSEIEILGFHPYKEVVFLSSSSPTGFAYHLNGSKIEVLGNMYPKEYGPFKDYPTEGDWFTSFPYTPCWMAEL